MADVEGVTVVVCLRAAWKKHLPPVFVEDILPLGLWIQQVCDELLKRWCDPGGKRLRCRLWQAARHISITMQHDGAELLVEVLVGPLTKHQYTDVQ